MMEEKHRSPVRSLTALFTFILVAVIAGMGLVLYVALQKLPPYAQEVNQNLKQANPIEEDSTGATVSESKLIARANMFFITPDTFAAQVEKDVRAYASVTGISIARVTPAPAPDPSKQVATIKTSGTASYSSVVNFIKALEKNVPKIAIETLTIQQGASPAEDSVTIETLTISMRVK